MIGSGKSQQSTEVSHAADTTIAGADPLESLPRLNHRQLDLDAWLSRASREGWHPASWLGLEDLLGASVVSDGVEVIWRASGLRRPGFVAQLSWIRRATRLGLAIETPLAHALVDRLLGFERLDGEARLQLTPVEWGVLTFVLARGLAKLAATEGPLGPWDLVLDRAGPDPFDTEGIGSIVTLRWLVRIGATSGSVRLWLPESLIRLWLASDRQAPPRSGLEEARFPGDLVGQWKAEAGTIAMPRGLSKLRVGGVLPLTGSPLRGTPRSPTGAVALCLTFSGTGQRLWFATEPVPHSGGGRLTIRAPLQRDPAPREGLALNPTSASPSVPGHGEGVSPTEIPVTLTVELGRVNLSLSRLADLKAGDVLELGRHSREPVELTSGGRLVARGELVLIDTELGVRITNVFL